MSRRVSPGAFLAIWVRVWPATRKSRGLLAGAAGSALAYAAFQVLRPWPLKWVLDGALAAEPTALPVPLDGRTPAQVIAAAALALIALAVGSALAAYGQRLFGARFGQTLAYRLRRDLFLHALRLAPSEQDRARTGDLVLRLTADMGLLRNLLVRSSVRLLSQALIVAVAAGLLVAHDWRAGLAALAVAPMLAWSARSSSRKIRTAVRKQRRRESEVAANAVESLRSVQLVKLHGAQEAEKTRFQSSHRRSFRSGLKAARLQAAFERRTELLIALGLALVLLFGAHRVLAGRATTGDLVVALAWAGMIYKPMRSFSRLNGRLAKGIVAGERVMSVFDRAAEDLHAPGALSPARWEGGLELRDVAVRWPDGRFGLQGVSVTIEPGERVAIVGRSGAGKTTLARLLPRLIEPTEGEIRLGGHRLDEYRLSWLREQMSFVLQETMLLGVSLRDNIRFGREDLSDDDLHRAARKAGIHERIVALPEGYDTVLREEGRGLSGGERRRVALARAFARRGPLVILDEPDSHLDTPVREALWETIDQLVVGRTSLCIVHDLIRARSADRVLVLEGGRLVGNGSHDELMRNCAEYRALAGISSPEGVVHAAG